jgi:hypothetical protein
LARVSGHSGPGARSPGRLVAPRGQSPGRTGGALQPPNCMRASSLPSQLGKALRRSMPHRVFTP